MKLLVLTGATVAFAELIEAFDEEMFSHLRSLGFTEFVFQYGFAKQAFDALKHQSGVVGFDRIVDLTPHIDGARLVVCPAGAGSILDVLRRPTPPKLVVCVNTKLMDNHQLEIAEALSPKHLIMCEPATVAGAVAEAMSMRFEKLPEARSLGDHLQEYL